jgi:hypothetical protein
MNHSPPHRTKALVALAAVLALTSCAAAPTISSPSPPAAPTAFPSNAHDVGADAAAEVASPALALVVADERGRLTLLDLDTEERQVIAESDSIPTVITGDGRLVYVVRESVVRESESESTTEVEVIDTGRWTVPHGDHTHSFLAEPQNIGEIDGTGTPSISPGEQRATVHFPETAELTTLVHEDLADVLPPAQQITADGPVIAFAGHLITANAGVLDIIDADGATVASIPCGTATDVDMTRVGAVVTCPEGAVLFTREVGGAVVGESIPFPQGAAVTTLDGRPDRPDLAGVTPNGAVLLDVRARTWTALPTDTPLVRAVAIGDDASRTVALDAEGAVRILAPDGSVLDRTQPLVADALADPRIADRVQLIVDAQHAYLTDPAAGSIHEIDHRDDARLTRTFTDLDPWFVQQVG